MNSAQVKTGVDIPFAISFTELEGFITEKAIALGALDNNHAVSIKSISIDKEERYIIVETEILEHLLH
jgi:hypothetical protein